jgi:hypothetical protein
MRLHGWCQVLYLCHWDCASEWSEVLLNSSKDPLSLPGWEVPCYYWSPDGNNCNFWPRTMLVPCIISRSHGSHICMQQTYTRQILWHIKKNDIYNKNDIKITYTNKKKLQRWRLTHLPSLLTRRHGYLRISRKVYPCIWVILDHRDLL